MQSRTSTLIALAICFAALANPFRAVTQQHGHYRLVDLGTFGGPQSNVNIPDGYAPALNDRGTVAGTADTATPDPYPSFCFNEDCFVSHALQSRNGVTTDLGVLPGGASSAASWISANGLIAGVSENGKLDPLVAGFPELRAVLWKNGHIRDLGTLSAGGYESLAAAVNSRGVVVGFATNTTSDSNSIFGIGYQTRAFRWVPESGMQDLGTLGGTDAAANLVNDKGQIVGESYIDSNPSAYCSNLDLPLTTGAFLWENGEMKNLGGFGGSCTFATDLNNRGEVIGLSTLPGDQTQHAFLWKNGSMYDLPNSLGGNRGAAIAINQGGDVVGWSSLPGDQAVHGAVWKNGTMTDLGTLGDDGCSVGGSINATGQVVGFTAPCDFSQTRAFIWENGSIADLNALIPEDSTLYLTVPETINDRGEIAGVGLDPNGNEHAFLLIPCNPDDSMCRDAAGGAPAILVRPATKPPASENQARPVRRLLQRHYGLGHLIGIARKSGLNITSAISGPNATLSPTSLLFRCRNVINAGCQCITQRTTTISNLGTATLSIKGISTTGAFTQTNNCGLSLGAGASCTISVRWSLANSAGIVDVADNAPGSPQTASLSGYKTCTPLL